MDKIEKEFKKFGLTKDKYPDYKDANTFGQQFKRCSILKYKSVSYSNSSKRTEHNNL